jgi:hypothetical protein
VDALQTRLAEIGLRATGDLGFALAGGMAIQAHGVVDRPSDDIDLFTAWNLRADFGAAVERVVEAYRSAGYEVLIERQFETFARLRVSDGASAHTDVDLAADWRQHPPVQLAIGPVLAFEDLMASKMSALYGRGEPRDFVDIDAALLSGRIEREELLRLAEAADSGFDRMMFAQSLARLDRLPAAVFARYHLPAASVEALRGRFGEWRVELLDGDGPSSTC